jgi:hypothetical protein
MVAEHFVLPTCKHCRAPFALGVVPLRLLLTLVAFWIGAELICGFSNLVTLRFA